MMKKTLPRPKQNAASAAIAPAPWAYRYQKESGRTILSLMLFLGIAGIAVAVFARYALDWLK